jgi:hypothetical protein
MEPVPNSRILTSKSLTIIQLKGLVSAIAKCRRKLDQSLDIDPLCHAKTPFSGKSPSTYLIAGKEKEKKSPHSFRDTPPGDGKHKNAIAGNKEVTKMRRTNKNTQRKRNAHKATHGTTHNNAKEKSSTNLGFSKLTRD